jgi:putative sterol carrier protein
MSPTQDFFETTLPVKIANDPDAARAVNAVFLFDIQGEGGGQWTAHLKDPLSVKAGEAGDAECIISCGTAEWEQILQNPQVATQLFFEGKLKVMGNVMLATKLQQIL